MVTVASPSAGSRPESPLAGGFSEYRHARAVELRAWAGAGGDDAQMRAALDRLKRRLDAGETLRQDVLPGYYLSIVV